MRRSRFLAGLAAVAALGTASTAARAQAYPSRPIHIIIPIGAGGVADGMMRVVTNKVTASMGQPFVIENRPGAGGNIGMEAVARAAPDGYTLMQGYVATHGTNPATRKIPYDAIKDFTPVGMIGGPKIATLRP